MIRADKTEVGKLNDEVREGGFVFEHANLDGTEYHRDRNASEFFHDQLLPLFDMSTCHVITQNVGERMKEIAAEVLRPGSTEPITDLCTLDYIWDLHGDYSISGDAVYHSHALDYYLGRTVQHVWGEGPLVKFIERDDLLLDKEREAFGEFVIVSPKFVHRRRHHGIKLDYPCHCGKVTYEMYAIPGVHNGGFAYLICEDTDKVLDVRNEIRVCDDCRA